MIPAVPIRFQYLVRRIGFSIRSLARYPLSRLPIVTSFPLRHSGPSREKKARVPRIWLQERGTLQSHEEKAIKRFAVCPLSLFASPLLGHPRRCLSPLEPNESSSRERLDPSVIASQTAQLRPPCCDRLLAAMSRSNPAARTSPRRPPRKLQRPAAPCTWGVQPCHRSKAGRCRRPIP